MASRKPHRSTGPSQDTRMLVYNRDGWRCARCGKDITYIQSSIQHRKARGMGGTKDEEINSPVNLIVLCGSGTTGCHGYVETHREEARERGWAVSQWADPADIPVSYPDGPRFLFPDGSYTYIALA